MNRRMASGLIALLLSACAPVSPEQQVIDDAVEAMGGAGRIRDVKALSIQGAGTAPNAGAEPHSG